MVRKIIPLVTSEKYHIYNRGVDKRTIFDDKFDYLRFYQTMAFFNTVAPTENYRLAKFNYSKSSQKLVQLHAYSLLPNHYHFIVEQLVNNGISEYMKRLSVGYTGFYNEKHNRSGVLFQGSYKRVHIETDQQYNYLLSYVNENDFVHAIERNREICHTSSLHFQEKKKSKLLLDNEGEYNFYEAKKLACQIYKRRAVYKNLLE